MNNIRKDGKTARKLRFDGSESKERIFRQSKLMKFGRSNETLAVDIDTFPSPPRSKNFVCSPENPFSAAYLHSIAQKSSGKASTSGQINKKEFSSATSKSLLKVTAVDSTETCDVTGVTSILDQSDAQFTSQKPASGIDIRLGKDVLMSDARKNINSLRTPRTANDEKLQVSPENVDSRRNVGIFLENQVVPEPKSSQSTLLSTSDFLVSPCENKVLKILESPVLNKNPDEMVASPTVIAVTPICESKNSKKSKRNSRTSFLMKSLKSTPNKNQKTTGESTNLVISPDKVLKILESPVLNKNPDELVASPTVIAVTPICESKNSKKSKRYSKASFLVKSLKSTPNKNQKNTDESTKLVISPDNLRKNPAALKNVLEAALSMKNSPLRRSDSLPIVPVPEEFQSATTRTKNVSDITIQSRSGSSNKTSSLLQRADSLPIVPIDCQSPTILTKNFSAIRNELGSFSSKNSPVPKKVRCVSRTPEKRKPTEIFSSPILSNKNIGLERCKLASGSSKNELLLQSAETLLRTPEKMRAHSEISSPLLLKKNLVLPRNASESGSSKKSSPLLKPNSKSVHTPKKYLPSEVSKNSPVLQTPLDSQYTSRYSPNLLKKSSSKERSSQKINFSKMDDHIGRCSPVSDHNNERKNLLRSPILFSSPLSSRKGVKRVKLFGDWVVEDIDKANEIPSKSPTIFRKTKLPHFQLNKGE